MSHVEHEYPRAYKAACEVDPMVLAGALDHIAKTAAKSRSMTRRIRWIQARAEGALSGDSSPDACLNLPKSAGPGTPEKLQKRLAYYIAMNHEFLEALKRLSAQCERLRLPGQQVTAAEQNALDAIAKAEGAQQ